MSASNKPMRRGRDMGFFYAIFFSGQARRIFGGGGRAEIPGNSSFQNPRADDSLPERRDARSVTKGAENCPPPPRGFQRFGNSLRGLWQRIGGTAGGFGKVGIAAERRPHRLSCR